MSEYDAFSETFARSRRSMRWPEIGWCLDAMHAHLAPFVHAPSILDVGAGAGRHVPEIYARWPDATYVGVDVSEGMLQEARKDYPDHVFYCLDMREIDRIGSMSGCQVFDGACFFASFHHLSTPEGRVNTLMKLRTVLAPHAIVAMTVWELLTPDHLLRYGDMRTAEQEFSIKIGQHVRYYHAFTREELSSLIRASGYHLMYCERSSTDCNIVVLFTLS